MFTDAKVRRSSCNKLSYGGRRRCRNGTVDGHAGGPRPGRLCRLSAAPHHIKQTDHRHNICTLYIFCRRHSTASNVSRSTPALRAGELMYYRPTRFTLKTWQRFTVIYEFRTQSKMLNSKLDSSVPARTASVTFGF
ncbi:hypothetical protein EVAR_86947_1 [Eumeta japonica]|uniref:Uncharacterized protein n=1 Tax=Eumeta variegata TaxID=151549 RepID=A0A4C1W985_EUMVA|nr:hypothetical protein EVAR_86947_1 [Eumeta japonica]